MTFNSLEFAFFLPIVLLLYWQVFRRNLRLQNLFILVVSYLSTVGGIGVSCC